MLWIAISVLLVAADQLSKWYVSTHFYLGQSVPVIPDVFHFTYWTNKGAAFSILPDRRWFFVVFTVLVIGAILVYVVKKKITDKAFLLSVTLVIAGAVGNLIDRWRIGEVIDFFDFCLINFPIFNVADVCVSIGAVILLISIMRSPSFQSGKEKKHDQNS